MIGIVATKPSLIGVLVPFESYSAYVNDVTLSSPDASSLDMIDDIATQPNSPLSPFEPSQDVRDANTTIISGKINPFFIISIF